MVAFAGTVRAQVVDFDTTHSVFQESPTRTQHVRLFALGRRRGPPLHVARGARWMASGRRVGRERGDQGRERLRRHAQRRRRHDGERPRLPQRGPGRPHPQGQQYLAHRRLLVRHRARLPVELAQRERPHGRLPAQHAVRARLRPQLRRSVQPRPGHGPAEPAHPLDGARELGGLLHGRVQPHPRRHLRGQLPGELGTVVDAGPRDAAHLQRAARRRLPERPVPQRDHRRGHQGPGARPQRPRARGAHRARRVLPAVDQGRHRGSRCARTTTPGPSTAAPPSSSSRSRSASRCD